MQEKNGLRLISWNVSWQSKATPRDRIAYLAAHKPDVVALQEVRNIDAYSTELNSIVLPHNLGLRVEHGLGLLVGARWPIERLDSIKFHIPDEENHFYRDPPAQAEVEIRMLSLKVCRDERPFELHVVHVPPGSQNGWRKIDTFRAVYNRLAVHSEMPRLLCGDFNEPRNVTKDGVTTWAGKNRHARKDPKKWAAAVESVLLGLAKFDLADAFRIVYSDNLHEFWSVQMRKSRRRYDHIFASTSLHVDRANYLPLNRHLSDHRPAIADFLG